MDRTGTFHVAKLSWYDKINAERCATGTQLLPWQPTCRVLAGTLSCVDPTAHVDQQSWLGRLLARIETSRHQPAACPRQHKEWTSSGRPMRVYRMVGQIKRRKRLRFLVLLKNVLRQFWRFLARKITVYLHMLRRGRHKAECSCPCYRSL